MAETSLDNASWMEVEFTVYRPDGTIFESSVEANDETLAQVDYFPSHIVPLRYTMKKKIELIRKVQLYRASYRN